MANSGGVTRASIERSHTPGLHVASLHRPGCDDHFIASIRLEGDSASAVFERAARAVAGAGAAIVSAEVIGLPFDNGQGRRRLEQAFGSIAWPVTWIDAPENRAAATGGIHIWAVEGSSVTPIRVKERILGTLLEDPCGALCRLGGLVPEDVAHAPPEQTTSIMNLMNAALDSTGMNFENTARTWFYNRDILSWYDDFNDTRNRFFTKHAVFDGLVPASTGMGGNNTADAALTAGLLAVKPKAGKVSVTAVPSPLQCPALEYGSSFSRAVELAFPDHRRLLVSGTASIAPEGDTLHTGDMDGQIRQTMDVVEAILRSRGMGWDAVSRGIAYAKRSEDIAKFAQFREQNGLNGLPFVTFISDICRDELLFEIEVDAILVDTQ